MSETQGSCNCGSIKVIIPGPITECLLCYCDNCRKAGGGPASANLILDESTVKIQDDKSVLKGYLDSNTDSGNEINRRFCSTCGSPIGTVSPAGAPGKIFLKASLFGPIPKPSGEAFSGKKPSWAPKIEGSAEM